MRREKGPRKCRQCNRYTSEAMYLVCGREICATCGKEEIVFWNKIVKEASDKLIKEIMSATGARSLTGLVGCSDAHGGETVNAQGVQNCTVVVSGKEEPCR
mgnify:CR=1 FL=1